MHDWRNQLLIGRRKTERAKWIIPGKQFITGIAGNHHFNFFAGQSRYQSGRQDRAIAHHLVQLFGSSRTQFQTTFDRKHLFPMIGADRSSRQSSVFALVETFLGKTDAE